MYIHSHTGVVIRLSYLLPTYCALASYYTRTFIMQPRINIYSARRRALREPSTYRNLQRVAFEKTVLLRGATRITAAVEAAISAYPPPP